MTKTHAWRFAALAPHVRAGRARRERRSRPRVPEVYPGKFTTVDAHMGLSPPVWWAENAGWLQASRRAFGFKLTRDVSGSTFRRRHGDWAEMACSGGLLAAVSTTAVFFSNGIANRAGGRHQGQVSRSSRSRSFPYIKGQTPSSWGSSNRFLAVTNGFGFGGRVGVRRPSGSSPRTSASASR